MELNHSTYILGTTVTCKKVVSRIQKDENALRNYFGCASVANQKYHVTLLPPFQTDCITASKIAIGCVMATLLSNHPLVNTLFSITQLDVISYNGFDHLYFPLQVERDASGSHTFGTYIEDVSKKIRSLGVTFETPILDRCLPHIAVYSAGNLKEDAGVLSVLEESRLHSSIPFRCGYPTLYAKHEGGEWTDLTHDLSHGEVD